MKKKGTPKIYFSRNIVLIETTFGEIIFSLRSGLSRMLSSDDIGLPVVRANNISHGNLDLNNDVKYWYQEDPQGANTNNYLIKKNDLLINFINSEKKMGTAALVKEEPKRATIYTTNILNLRTKSGIDPYYIFMITKTLKYKNYIKSITKPAVNQASFTTVDFKKFSLKLPSFEEQQKIGYFFKNLDDTISLHQQELEALKQTKQGFLQKMFPRETETVPQIRFKGFLGEWKSKTFSAIVERVSKQSSSDSLPKLEFEDIISGEGRLNKDISEKFDNRKGIVFEPGYILFGKLRPYLKNWLLPKFNGIALGDFWVFTTKHSPEFVYSLIQTNKFQTVANLSTGTKMPRSDWKTVSTTEFLIPSIEEQLKIGEFFRQLDEVIELKEKEIEALKETKKGFLQKMFV